MWICNKTSRDADTCGGRKKDKSSLSVFRVGKAENHVLCILRVQFCEIVVTEAGRYPLLFLKYPAETVLFYLNFSLSCYKYILFNSVTAVSPTPYCLELDIYAQVFISVFIFIGFIYFHYIFIFICGRFESHHSEYLLRRKLTLFHPKPGQYPGITSCQVPHFPIHHHLSCFW